MYSGSNLESISPFSHWPGYKLNHSKFWTQKIHIQTFLNNYPSLSQVWWWEKEQYKNNIWKKKSSPRGEFIFSFTDLFLQCSIQFNDLAIFVNIVHIFLHLQLNFFIPLLFTIKRLYVCLCFYNLLLILFVQFLIFFIMNYKSVRTEQRKLKKKK